MTNPHWFEAQITFTCPKCKQQSAEILYLSAPTLNLKAVVTKIREIDKKCKNCGKSLTEKIQVDVGVKSITLAEARAKGARRSDGSPI
jgi:transcription elongation factor Elf1